MENGNCASIPPERPAVTITQEGAEVKLTFRRALSLFEQASLLLEFRKCADAAELYAASH